LVVEEEWRGQSSQFQVRPKAETYISDRDVKNVMPKNSANAGGIIQNGIGNIGRSITKGTESVAMQHLGVIGERFERPECEL
jgi:hypothetical protein